MSKRADTAAMLTLATRINSTDGALERSAKTTKHGDSNLSLQRNLSMTRLSTLLVALTLATGAPALALPPLNQVKEIDRPMLSVAMAIEISDKCPTIAARTLKGLNYLWSLKKKASDMGYSDDEIKAYIDSDAEKTRIRKLAEDYAAGLGFDATTTEGLCALGQHEMAQATLTGSFLREK